MKIINYTKARLNLRETLDHPIKTGLPTVIISKNDQQVVLISKAKYDELKDGKDD